MMHLVTKATPMDGIPLLCLKMKQLVIQIQYHMNNIIASGVETHTHTVWKESDLKKIVEFIKPLRMY